MVRLLAGDLRTGLIRERSMPVTSAKIDLTLNKPETIDCALQVPWIEPLSGLPIPLADVLLPGKSFLAWEENGVILGGGPIWSDAWSQTSNELTYRAAGIESMFDYRFVLPLLAPADLPSDVSSSFTTSLRTQAKRLVETALIETGGELPIVLEADIAGTAERTYLGADLVRVRQALDNLRSVQGGPDISFRPRYQTDRRYIEWVMVTGTPLTQEGADHVWDATVPGSVVSNLRMSRDGSKLVTRQFETGATVADVRLEAKSVDGTLISAGFPLMEDSTARGSVSELTTLQAHADGATELGRTFEETVSFDVARAPSIEDPTFGTIRTASWLGDFLPGHMAQLVLPENPYKPAARYRHRIVQLSASLTGDVALTLAPERTTAAYPIPVSDRQWVGQQFRALRDRVDEAVRGS